MALPALGYDTPGLLLTFDRALRSVEFDSGRLVQVARINGTVSGGGATTSASFHAVRVFCFGGTARRATSA